MGRGAEGQVRALRPSDLPRVGAIFRAAFNDLYRRRGFGPVVSDAGVGRSIAAAYGQLDPEHCLVVTRRDAVVGSGFLHVRGATAGVGPITVDPAHQGAGFGLALMDEICARADRSGVRSLRVIQDAFNESSFSFYGRLGFVARELLARGSFPSRPSKRTDGRIRRASRDDLEDLVALDRELLGIERPIDHAFLLANGEIFVAGRAPLEGSLARVVRGDVTVLGPGVSTDLEVLLELIRAATRDLPRHSDTRLLVAASQADFLRAMYDVGFKVHSLCTYMVRGEFQGFRGYYVPTLFPESG